MSPRPFLLLLLLAACSRDASNPAPPRVTTPHAIPAQASTIVIPVSAQLADLQRLVEAEVPRTLATINRHEKACVAAETIKIAGRRLKITPDISCDIVGTITRGPIRLSGSGSVIKLVMPVHGVVSARDIGHVIKSETATATAEVRADIRLGITGDWQPTARIVIDYGWTEKPGVMLLGQRVTFAGKADPALAKVIAKLETDLPKKLDKLHPRAALERAWARGFTVIELNRRKPPAWLRLMPQRLHYDGYRIVGDTIILDLAAMALTDTFVGARPADPPPTPLPPPSPIRSARGFRFHLPVIADYALLEPVLERALGKLSKRRIALPAVGEVTPQFGKVTMYATENGRMAIGIAMTVKTPEKWIDARGTVWLTGQPFNVPGSQRIFVRDLTVDGHPDTPAFRLLLAVAKHPTVNAELRTALSQDFARDYAKVMRAADRALAEQRIGDFVLNARIDNMRNGTVFPAGQGLYMPVDASGSGALRYAPEPKTGT